MARRSNHPCNATRSGAEEHLEWAGVSQPPGRYPLWVHGAFVAGERSPFTLDLEPALVVPLPDEIPADLPARSEPVGADARLIERLQRDAPPAPSGAAERSRPALINPFGVTHPSADGRCELSAGLLIAHGVLRLFHPYFADVGDTLDERLL
jgi:hypothetical protein